MSVTTSFADDATVAQRILDHIDHKTTDLGETSWREPVENYRSEPRLAAELALLRSTPIALCPSAALPETGSYVAREAAGTPILAVRGADGRVRAFRNACRHRGTQLVEGTGCERAFVCRYHGWTYNLEGRLRHVPHEDGFPGLDKETRGLVPVEARELHGLVFVTQEKSRLAEQGLDQIPLVITPDYRLSRFAASERDIPANWKVLAEGFLEGYHIRSTHPGTFYPLQYDNLNVVETCGRNARLAFPFRAIEKLREVPAAQWSADGRLTYLYHLFPNVMLATFPARIVMVALEPLAADRTRMLTWALTNHVEHDVDAEDKVKRGFQLVDAGAAEDRDVACAIQRGIASGANEFFEFGRFEQAIGHFHRTLHALLAGAAPDSSGS